MLTLGIAGLANAKDFLSRHLPEQMESGTGAIQGMDAAAALLLDGRVVAAASQERFDRIKKSGAFPIQSIRYCLEAAGAKMTDVSNIGCNFNFARYRPLYAMDRLGQAYWQECLSPEAIQTCLRQGAGDFPTARFCSVDHHEAHLHAALASSGFDRCLAIVMDAAGEVAATSIYLWDGAAITNLARHPITQSLGIFYSLVTQYLGYAFNEDEYKVMGLASFGDPERFAPFFQSAILLAPNGGVDIPYLRLNRGFVDNLFFHSSTQAIERGIGLDGKTCSHQERADISAGLQRRFTEALFHICAHYQQATNTANLLLSGGCAENCAAIGELRSSGMFERIHVAYASGDEGTALGAGAAVLFADGKPLRLAGRMPFFGPAPGIEAARIALSFHPDLMMQEFGAEQPMLEAAALDIAKDRIVALCNGRMEYGARALGNRSLLALPSNGANKDRINLAIKKRQNYRPFAPAVTAEDAHKYFLLNEGEEYPYMTMLTHVRPDAVTRLPAVTHVDGTARVQTVSREHNPAFHYLLSRLKELTGVPVVLNTSYNVNHQPIVCSESEAIETFLEMGIDALYMANAKITRRHAGKAA